MESRQSDQRSSLTYEELSTTKIPIKSSLAFPAKGITNMVNTACSSLFSWSSQFLVFLPNVAPKPSECFLWKLKRFPNFFLQHVWPCLLRRNEWLSRMPLNDFNFKLDSSDAFENVIELSPSLLSSERNLLNANDLRRGRWILEQQFQSSCPLN